MKSFIRFLLISTMTLAVSGMHLYQTYRVKNIDEKKSKIYWRCDKHHGIFPLDSGKVIWENGKISEGIFYINLKKIDVIDLDSADYKTAKAILENTLKNEFFEADKYPLTFFHLQRTFQKNNRLFIEGDMYMHGQTVCLKIPVKIKEKAKYWHLVSDTFKIDRTDWGIYRLSPQRPYEDDEHGWTVPDTVLIQFDIVIE